MRQRGKQSAAAASMPFSADGAPVRLQPPDHLTVKEAKLFNEVVANAPPNQFSQSDQYLLATFASVTILIRDAAKAAARANDKNRQMRFKMLLEAIKTQTLVATKLRLTTQARISPRTAGRSHDTHRPSAYDKMGGWDFDNNWRS